MSMTHAEQVRALVEALAYTIRAYEHESDAEDTLLMVPEGSVIFSVASARTALSAIDLPAIVAALDKARHEEATRQAIELGFYVPDPSHGKVAIPSATYNLYRRLVREDWKPENSATARPAPHPSR